MSNFSHHDPGNSDVRKVVLAYSGGLDTSVILRWLQDTYSCEVVTYTADLGQGTELERARSTAERLGIREIHVEDLRNTFVSDYVFPMFRANALYEGVYLLGTAIARPLIAARQVELARACGADAVAHGATGKGNDQVRFELSYYALDPDIRVIAPWREWKLNSREQLIEFAMQHQLVIPHDSEGEAPFSIDGNLLHVSSEGKILEDPGQIAPRNIYSRTDDPASGSTPAEDLSISFEKGDPVALNGIELGPAEMLGALNDFGGRHGIGRLDLVENRMTGMKSRGIYETPGGTILIAAHRAIESITLDPEVQHLKDDLMPRYARLVYDGLWFSPERELLQGLIDASQTRVNGQVQLRLFRGGFQVISRSSPDSLYRADLVTFEGGGPFSHKDAAGFIQLRALRLKTWAKRKQAAGKT